MGRKEYRNVRREGTEGACWSQGAFWAYGSEGLAPRRDGLRGATCLARTVGRLTLLMFPPCAAQRKGIKVTRFVVLFAALLLLAGSAQASPFVYSPFGLQIDVGAGMKWDHSQRGSLQFQDSPWVAGGITKTMGDSRWSVTGTFERQAVQEADYLIRAGLWYRIGP